MDINELKFVLKLLEATNYRQFLAKIKLGSMKVSERDKICRQLAERELVGVSYEISKFKIAPAGVALLKKIESTQLPVSSEELKVLKSCQKAATSPSKTGISASEAQTLVQALLEKGLIQVNKTDKKLKEAWLTERGKTYLQQEYEPSGAGNITLSKNMLAIYLKFLRHPSIVIDSTHQPSDEDILQTIRELDKQFDTDNYLPIFHLRQKLQPPLSGEDLEKALYRLETSDKIELSALVEASRYSPAQVNMGIKQLSGSPLFFIKVNT